MHQYGRTSRNQAELADLLAEYFGEKLSPSELEQLTAQAAAALEERGKPLTTAPRDADGGGHPADP